MMKRLLYIACISVSMLLCSCEYSKWDTYEDLVGEWHSNYPFVKESKLIFYEDGMCVVENVPIKETDPWGGYDYSLFWLKARGNEKFQEKVQNMDSWNFQGYWKIKEDTLYYKSRPYYRYHVLMSPHLEMLGTEQVRDSFMQYTDVDDAFWVSIDAWTESFFPPATLHYLSFYTRDPDNDYCFFKKD